MVSETDAHFAGHTPIAGRLRTDPGRRDRGPESVPATGFRAGDVPLPDHQCTGIRFLFPVAGRGYHADYGTELDTPQSDRLSCDENTSLGQEIFDITMAR